MQVKLNREELAHHVGRLISGDRNATHGDPHIQFTIHSMFMDIVRYAEGYRQQNNMAPLNSVHRHVIIMDLAKTSRILVGNADDQDHYLDKAGYNLIGAEACGTRVAVREVEDPPMPAPAEMTTEQALEIMALEEALDPTGEGRAAHAAESLEAFPEEDEDTSHSPNPYDEAEIRRQETNRKNRERYAQRKELKEALTKSVRRTPKAKESRVEDAKIVEPARASVHGKDGQRAAGVRWGRGRYGRPSARSESHVGAGRKHKRGTDPKDL